MTPMFSLDQLKETAQKVANVYSRIANERLQTKLPVPARLYFDLELLGKEEARCAGMAYQTGMKVILNTTLLMENPEEVLNQTIGHEYAHLVQFDKFSNKGAATTGHGPEWHAAMKVFGLPPTKKHSMNVANSLLRYKKEGKKRGKKKEQRELF